MKKTDTIPFLTDDGTEVDFCILEQTTINGINYLLVSEQEDPEGDEDTIVYIMREAAQADDDMITYEFVEEDDELESVSKVFEQLLEDLRFEVE